MRRCLPFLLILALLLCLTPAAAAKAPPAKNATSGDAAVRLSPELLELADPSVPPTSTSREELIERMQGEGQYRRAGAAVRGIGLRAPSDLVYVYVALDPRAPLSTVDRHVWQVRSRDEPSRTVAAWVEVPRLLGLAAEPGVVSVRPVQRPVAATGSVTADGDRLLLAERVRGELGLTGAGVKVGVISDGVDHWAGAAATGDLPGDLHVLRNSLGGDEGTAMLEIIHDIAPGAELYFHDWGENSIDFTRSVDALADAGCTVIVDDVSWIDEPFFQDGPVAAHVQALVSTRNLLYVSSAGNWAPNHYQGTYADDGDGFHDFSGGTSARRYLYLRIPAGGYLRAVLEWDDPWSGSRNDYDLYLYDTADYSSPIAASTGWQNGGGSTPLELVSYQNTGSAAIEAEIDVSNYNGGAAARTLEVYLYPAGGTQVHGDNIVAADSVFGQAAAPAVVSVGAIDAADPGCDTIEWYSSRGPATIRSPATVQRQKPDVAGVDGVRITGAGGFGSGGRFYGTSAAAPAVAAVSALLWSGAPARDAVEVRTALLASAVDLGPAGPDTSFGSGRVDAVAFAESLGIGTTDVTVTSIAPDRGVSGTTVTTANLSGTGFRAGASVVLRRAGAPEITAAGLEVVSPTAIACRLGLPAAAEPGAYDVVVTNPGGANATLIGGFTVVNPPGALPGSGAPGDPDGDGRYDDVNGNGRADFADVVLYFNQMTWIAANEPVSAFDYNGNGRIDFADVVRLFDGL